MRTPAILSRAGTARAVLLFFVSTFLTNYTYAEATGSPGNPHLRNDANGSGNYTVSMTMWWGNNGTSWRLYENGTLVLDEPLVDNSPQQQDAEYQVTGKPNGTYQYSCELVNQYGTNACAEATTVVVKNSGSGDTTPPSTPTDLVLDGKTSSSVTLSWSASTDNLGVADYIVSYGSGSVTSVTTSVNVTGLTADTAYTFTVQARDAAGNVSPSSAPLSVTTDAVGNDVEAPSVPQNLRSPSQTANSIDLSWDASTDNVGVSEYAVTAANKTTRTPNTSVTLTDLDADSLYTVVAHALDAAGNASADSAPLNVRTLPQSECAAPGAPPNVQLRHDNWSGLPDFTLNATIWYGNNGCSWEVYENDQLIYSGELVDNSPQQQDAYYTVTGKPNGTYEYWVKIINNLGASSSSPVTITVTQGADDTEAPSAPQNLRVTGTTHDSATLAWDAATDNIALAGYRITGGFSKLQVSASATSVTVEGLQAESSYIFTAYAEDTSGNLSLASNSVDVVTPAPDLQVPSQPQGLQATDVTAVSISLSWTPSTDNVAVAGYDVSYAGKSVFTAQPQVTLQNLDSDRSYEIVVTAVDTSDNRSQASAPLTVTTEPFDQEEPNEVLFDDFSYTSVEDPEFLEDWKASDYGPAAPGSGVWSKDNVIFMADPHDAQNTQVRMLFKTAGSDASTTQAEIEGKKRFLYGTYASRMRFYNQPIAGPMQEVGPETGDRMIETFFAISPYTVPNDLYGELDFEYLPMAGWNPDEGGRPQGPTMWNTTWKNRWDRVHNHLEEDFSGEHIFWMTVTPQAVNYYMDDRLLTSHTDTAYIPDDTMLVMWNIWIHGERFAAGQNGVERTWAQDMDWFFHAKDEVLDFQQVKGFVSQYKAAGIAKRDTLPPLAE